MCPWRASTSADHRLDLGRAADIGLDRCAEASEPLDFVIHLTGLRLALAVVEYDVGAGLGKGDRNPTSDTTASAGDQCHTPGQICHYDESTAGTFCLSAGSAFVRKRKLWRERRSRRHE